MSSPFTELVFSRKSIRKYKKELPPELWIEDMIKCASRAPSPSNRQPVRFIRIASSEIRNQLYKQMNNGRDSLLAKLENLSKPKKMKNRINAYFRFSEFMTQAPLLFAVGIISDQEGFSSSLADAGLIYKDHRGRADADISTGLALQSFIFRAQELGLGTCILTAPLSFVPEPEKLMGIKDIEIRCFVTAGYPAESPADTPRKPLSEICLEI